MSTKAAIKQALRKTRKAVIPPAPVKSVVEILEATSAEFRSLPELQERYCQTSEESLSYLLTLSGLLALNIHEIPVNALFEDPKQAAPTLITDRNEINRRLLDFTKMFPTAKFRGPAFDRLARDRVPELLGAVANSKTIINRWSKAETARILDECQSDLSKTNLEIARLFRQRRALRRRHKILAERSKLFDQLSKKSFLQIDDRNQQFERMRLVDPLLFEGVEKTLASGQWSNFRVRGSDHTLWFATRLPIVLSHNRSLYNFGRLAVSVRWDMVAHLPRLRKTKVAPSNKISLLRWITPAYFVRVLPFSHNMRVNGLGGLGYFHPHVSREGALCLGDCDEAFMKAANTADLSRMLEIVFRVLSTYNSSSPFFHLDELTENEASFQISDFEGADFHKHASLGMRTEVWTPETGSPIHPDIFRFKQNDSDRLIIEGDGFEDFAKDSTSKDSTSKDSASKEGNT